MQLSNQCHDRSLLPPGQGTVTLEIGGCVGPRACRDIVDRNEAYYCRESKFDPQTSPRLSH